MNIDEKLYDLRHALDPRNEFGEAVRESASWKTYLAVLSIATDDDFLHIAFVDEVVGPQDPDTPRFDGAWWAQ